MSGDTLDLKYKLSFPYEVKHLPKSSPKRVANYPLDWEYITIHNTLEENTDSDQEYDRLADPKNTSIHATHIIIDEVKGIEIIPPSENVWSCGDGQSGQGNRSSIVVTLCVRTNENKVIANSAELIAHLLWSKGYNIDRIKQHFEWNGKNCPRALRRNGGLGWNRLIQSTQKKLDELNNDDPYESKPVEYPAEMSKGCLTINILDFLSLFGGNCRTINRKTEEMVYECHDKVMIFINKLDRFTVPGRKPYIMQCPAKLVSPDGDMYVPLSSMVSLFGGRVDSWDKATNTAVCSVGKKTIKVIADDPNIYYYDK